MKAGWYKIEYLDEKAGYFWAVLRGIRMDYALVCFMSDYREGIYTPW